MLTALQLATGVQTATVARHAAAATALAAFRAFHSSAFRQSMKGVAASVTPSTPSGTSLKIDWEVGDPITVPAVLLRDHCRCTECYDHQSNARLFHMSDLTPAARTAEVAKLTNDGSLTIDWKDGHTTRFSNTFVAEHFRRRRGLPATTERGPAHPVAWGAAGPEAPAAAGYAALMGSTEGLAGWLTTMDKSGVALVKGAPNEPAVSARVADRFSKMVAFPHLSVPNAHTTARAPHTPMCRVQGAPAYMVMHAPEGSACDVVVVDGLAVAKNIQAEDPEAFEALTSLPVSYHFGSAPTDELKPVFSMSEGSVVAVSYDNRHARLYGAPLARAEGGKAVEAWYRGAGLMDRLLRDEAAGFRRTVRLEGGDVLAVDNRRVLSLRPEQYHRILNTAFADGAAAEAKATAAGVEFRRAVRTGDDRRAA